MTNQPERNLLYLNSMPWEMMVDQGRLWEVRGRNLEGYCQRCCSVFFGSEKNKSVEIEEGKNICYCIENSPQKIKISLFRNLYRVLFLVMLTLRLWHICKKNRINVIISQSNALRDLEIASLIVSKLHGIPMLGYIGRNSTSLKPSKKLTDKIAYRMEVTILSCMDKVILRPKSENILSKYYKINPAKIITIPHSTRFHEFAVSSKMSDEIKEWIADRKVILYYGRMEEDKLVEDIIRAFHLVRDKFDGVLLLLIGFGNKKNKLELLVNEMELNNYVRFEPSTPQEKLATISAKADVHIHPTGGKGLLESAVMGRPVITYDSFSYDYGLVEHMKTGLKARFRNFESIAGCITMYLENSDLGKKHGEALRKKSIAKHNVIAVHKKLSEKIEKAIKNKNNKKRSIK